MNKGSIMADTKSAMHIDAALVRQLAELLDETKLTEIEVEDGDRKIRVARNVSAAAAAPIVAASAAPLAVLPSAETLPLSNPNAVKSPMVGTVYLSAEPGSKPFAAVGDTIKEGDTIVIIEAMKVMNPIPAPRAGKVMHVLIENGQPVEFDQPLIVIE
jgi:acetyl-CoA carboxylase biotin carboxyl carrier protein